MIKKSTEKELALKLRRKGLSYNEILVQVPVAKSTLSLWLHSLGLSKKQQQRITEKKLTAMQRGWEKVHQLRMKRWASIRKDAAREVKKLSKSQRWIAGVMLYWAEGAKEKIYRGGTCVKFSNSDVTMILLFRYWLIEFFSVLPENIRYELYIHEKANWVIAKEYWANQLDIPEKDVRVYFKRHNPKPGRKNVGVEYKGLIRLSINGSIPIVRKISGWVDGIYNNWGVV